MAIKGMVEIEDIRIFWTTEGVPGGRVFVRVSEVAPEAADSEMRTVFDELDLGQFMNVLTLALSNDGEGTNKDTAWDDAEQITDALGGIRICP